jgi:alpha-aminoadipate/glutamate carrier protein LysW
MPSAVCPECDELVYVDPSTEQGELIRCDECETDLVLVGLDPIELDPHEEVDKDEYDEGFNIFDNDD